MSQVTSTTPAGLSAGSASSAKISFIGRMFVQIERFSQLHRICQRAAKEIEYPRVIDYLHKNLPKEWWDIGESTVIFFLPKAIMDLDHLTDRRAALETIPEDTPVKNLRRFIEDGIVILWKKRHELEQ